MKKVFSRRLLSVFLSALLCFTCIYSPAVFAAEAQPPAASTPESIQVEADSIEDEETEPTGDSLGSTNQENSSTDTDEPEDTQPAALSEAAQAFVDAVGAIDREAVLRTANAWGIAHKAWLADQDDADLKAALDAAVNESDEAAASLYAAEDMFYELSENEQENEAVQAAYLSLMSVIAAMHLTMDNPTEPSNPNTEGSNEPPSDSEIAAILYGDLPDAPTGSYMGSYGLPVAVGETKISIGKLADNLMSGNAGRLDADALNVDGIEITVPLVDGENYAIIPILAQVEYPANGSGSHIILPEGVTLLSPNGTGRAATADETTRVLNSTYTESSAAASGILVRASEDFTVRFVYEDGNNTKLEKGLTVHVGEGVTSADAVLYNAARKSATFAERPTPSVTSGKITQVQQVGGTWLIWFNGQEAYCCDCGLTGKVDGCPTYSYSHTSIVEASQYTPGDHYRNQVEIWGGLGQMSLGFLSGDTATFAARTEDENAADCYNDTQRWIMENYPDSVAAQAYRTALHALTSGISTFASDTDVYAYIYEPPIGGW